MHVIEHCAERLHCHMQCFTNVVPKRFEWKWEENQHFTGMWFGSLFLQIQSNFAHPQIPNQITISLSQWFILLLKVWRLITLQMENDWGWLPPDCTKIYKEKFLRLHTCQNCWFLYKSVIGDTEVTQQWHADSGVCWRAGLRGLCSLVGLQFLPCQDWSRHSWWFWQWLTQIHTAWCLLHWKGSESTSSAPGLLFQLACSI